MTLGDRIRRFFEPSKPWNIMFLIAIGVLIGYMAVINARTSKTKPYEQPKRSREETRLSPGASTHGRS
jgi:F0F1-type ATP synthase assembly protein I